MGLDSLVWQGLITVPPDSMPLSVPAAPSHIVTVYGVGLMILAVGLIALFAVFERHAPRDS